MRPLTRRYPAILALLAVILGLAPSTAAPTPSLAGTTRLVSTIGPAGVIVTLPRAVTVDLTNPGSWIQPAAIGHVGGVVIDGIKRAPSARIGLIYTRLASPAGCSLDGRCTPVEALGVRVPGGSTYARPTASTLTLPAGAYRVYVIGSYTNRPQSVTLRLPGLGGSATIRATTQAQDAWLFGESFSGLNDGTLQAHPEYLLRGYWSTYDGLPAYARGLNIGVRGPAVLAGGVWQSLPTKGAEAVPVAPALSSCWQITAGASSGPPDFWYLDPAANYHYFTGGYSPSCIDQENAGKDRAFGLARRDGSALFEYRRANPVIAPGQRVGWFAFTMRLLDVQ